MTINLNPPRGFRDLYPPEKQIQEYIFDKLKNTANLFGFSFYDGPILENIAIYLDKTSKELIQRQTFSVKTKNETLIMRPEMTPSLARMIANKTGQLNFPLKLFNLGLRFRYEAPQKGREREFYQADFDILGSDSIISDAEIINTAVKIFTSFGATEKDFVLYINSRQEMEKNLLKLGFSKKIYKQLLEIIDKQDKVSNDSFIKSLLSVDNNKQRVKKLVNFLFSTRQEVSSYFVELFSILKKLKIDKYCQVNYNIVRGLDYYTGLVFEIKQKGPFQLKRALLGGGRYDNLISNFNPKNNIQGVGFAASDVAIWEFLQTNKLLPNTFPAKTKVLATIFDPTLIDTSIKIVNLLRKNNISAEFYLDLKKLDKQLKYADKKGIPYVIIIGPEEAKSKVYKLKNMKTGEQKTFDEKKLIEFLISN